MLFLSILVCLVILIDQIWSSCESASQHEEFLKEYFKKDREVKLAGFGSFGVVTIFKRNENMFAVKEVEMSGEKEVFDRIQAKIQKERQYLVDHLKLLLKECNGFWNYRLWSELPGDKFEGITKEESDVLQELFMYFKKVFNFFLNEIEANSLISKKAIENPNRILNSFKFCIQLTGIKYLIVQEKLGLSFRKEKFLEVFKTWSIQEQVKLYFRVILDVKYLNDIGIVHCDLKEDNILWKDKNYKEFAIIDFGLSSMGSKCKGGTEVYMAPEASDRKIILTDFEDLIKADSHSLGRMITLMHEKVTVPGSNLLANDQIIENRVKRSQHRQQMKGTESLKTQQESQYLTEMPVIIIASPRELLESEFEWVTMRMTESDYKNRLSITQACRSFWVIYQIASNLSLPVEKALDFFQTINFYLDEVLDGKSVCEDLPLDNSWTHEVDKYNKKKGSCSTMSSEESIRYI
jgi:serine/threonine protein kinase